ncbi:MAG: 2-succinyl-5-enolpyruvyl-6-hydroxy-3-cyclohexene-1-carboxylic-acid synthase [Microthrixaceae bacterium]|nr:2-succinyl-5-enolpyruvyl-6-hydroxy-3-cyclohexene-1-carboxylic-acid synthase [Microthrixaceae bacterium]
MQPRSRPQGSAIKSTSGDPGATVANPDTGNLASGFCATLVHEWAERGLTDAVVCPGSRNTPISVALAANPSFTVHVVHDERSASFMALGLALATGRPAVLTCTSGSAPAHFHPAVLEADLSAVPMLVLTADRPPELHGVLAPQTTEQRDLYGSAVRWYCEPGAPADGSQPWWRDLARDALSRATGGVPGPVHLNLAFREPLLGAPEAFSAADGLPDTPAEAPRGPELRWNLTDEDAGRLGGAISGRRGIVVAGARSVVDEEERRVVLEFAEAMGWPLLADAGSGLRVPSASLVPHFDAIVRSGCFEDHPPEVVLRLGGLLTSKALGGWLARSGAQQFGIDRFGMCPDPDGVLTAKFNLAPSDALGAIRVAGVEPGPDQWRDRWQEAQRLAAGAIGAALEPRGSGAVTEPAVAREVMASMPEGGRLFVSSSMPVRDLEGFAAPRTGVVVYSNRGTNGIDGSIATACGIAIGSAGPTVALCGDLAFLHDIGSLSGLAGRGVELTIVVVDNDGGGIFHFLPQAQQLDGETFESLFGTPHGLDLVSVASGFGLQAERVASQVGLAAVLAGARTRGGVRVVVVPSARTRNVDVHRALDAVVADALGVL